MNDIKVFENVSDISNLSKTQLAKIESRLPDYFRGKKLIGHKTSQTSYSLQTMNMISDSPLSRMKQCLAQIDRKYTSIRENFYKMEKKKLVLSKLEQNKDYHSRLTVDEYKYQIQTVSEGIETLLREIGMFQNMYDSIMKQNNIPENWTEKDYENQEIQHMVKSSFRLAIQDISASGRVSHACVEYWEQLGIHPQLAEIRVRKYLENTQRIINEIGAITIQLMYDFLDEMVKEFGNEYKLALKRIGLNELGSEEFMAKGETKPQ